jgi:hypothetical protein
VRGAAAGMALEIRFSFCGLDSVLTTRAMAAATANKMSVPRVNMLLADRSGYLGVDGCLPINCWGGEHVNLYIYYVCH